MLTSLSSFTQANYPRLVISNGDSLVLQTIEQTRWVSKQLEIAKACELASVIKDSIIIRKTINEKYLNEIISIQKKLILSKDSTIADKDTIITIYKKLNTDLMKKNKSLKFQNKLFLIGSGIITLLLIVK